MFVPHQFGASVAVTNMIRQHIENTNDIDLKEYVFDLENSFETLLSLRDELKNSVELRNALKADPEKVLEDRGIPKNISEDLTERPTDHVFCEKGYTCRLPRFSFFEE